MRRGKPIGAGGRFGSTLTRCGRTATISGHEDLQKAAPLRVTPAPSARLEASGIRRRNRMLAIQLAGVAAFGFATVLTLALLLHYAEAHHLLANL